MKKNLFIFLVFCVTININAQNKLKQKNDSITVIAQKLYNEDKYEQLYTLMGEKFKEQLDFEKFSQTFSGLKKQLGNWNKNTFWGIKEITSHYKAEFENSPLSFYVNLDEKEKIFTFLFRPFKDDKEKRKEKVKSNNTLQSEMDKKIDEFAQKYLSNPKTVGLSIGIINNGKMQYYHYGETKKDNTNLPNNTTLYEIGSISKTFTSLLLAQAIENKKTTLNTPINTYLRNNIPNLAFEGKKITLENLANHSSGLPRLPDNLLGNPNTIDENPYKNYSDKDLFEFLEKYKLTRPVLKEYEYSNLSFGLLGVILEKINKKSYEQQILTQICQPFGMKNTKITLNEKDKKEHFAQGYNEEGKAVSSWEFQSMAAAGAIRSNIEDMLKYINNYLNPDKNMLNSINLTKKVTFEYAQNKVGLGWHIAKSKEYDIWQHGGGTGGFRTLAAFCPDTKNGVVVLSNMAEEVTIAFDIMEWLNKK
ncbi:MAG: DUF3887 domain-containing protein [Cytophagia bacterium]|nr:MAG: DUF3887 domain-containing protein [Cytophagia bacterium]TAG41484.1 MAG: DUF3887 domain-containing protein [Cytophagia bacterium]